MIGNLIEFILGVVSLIAGLIALFYRNRMNHYFEISKQYQKRMNESENELAVVRHANRTLIRMRDQYKKDLDDARKRMVEGSRDHLDNQW